MNRHVKYVLDNLQSRIKVDRYILGIDGLSRSGKTTITNEIKEYLTKLHIPHYIFHIDNHIVEQNLRYNTPYDEWYEYYQLQWDVEGLREQLFTKLKTFSILTLPFYDETTDSTIYKEVSLPKRCFVIIEGVFLQRKEWRTYFNYFIFINSSKEKRFNRENDTTKQNIEKFERRYWKAEDYYINTIDPISRAHLVLNS